jgi:glycine/D-amino acid oxidase-like deaminating enzyme
MPTRREMLEASLALPAVAVTESLMGQKRGSGPRVVVVGAGAFGGWSALELQRRGARVTLIDAWGPGNARASSGGATRVIRATYGSRAIYTEMAARALARWREHDRRWQRGFFRQTGALWMFGEDDSFGRASIAAFEARGLSIDELTAADARRRYPQINFDGVRTVLFEPEAGYLLARRACEHVVDRVQAEGGDYRLAAVRTPVTVGDSTLESITLEDGSRIQADRFVFACGPWMPRLFPDVIGSSIKSTRQEVYYFGPAAGDARFVEPALPVWVDFGKRLIYGIPGNANRGFKVADDTSGPPLDPTSGERDATAAGIEAARAFLKRRFPDLASAPMVGSEVCQYESTPDSHFVVDRHPGASNVWIAGGGSGHGFKMGPAIGEIVAGLVLGTANPIPAFGVARFAASGPVGEEKWS